MYISKISLINILFFTLVLSVYSSHIVQPNFQENIYNVYPLELNTNHWINQTIYNDFTEEKKQFQSKNNKITIFLFFVFLANVINWFEIE